MGTADTSMPKKPLGIIGAIGRIFSTVVKFAVGAIVLVGAAAAILPSLDKGHLATAAESGVAEAKPRTIMVSCHDDYGEVDAQIDMSNATVQFNTYTGNETYKDGEPEEGQNAKCKKFVRETDQAYKWGFTCDDPDIFVIYTLNRYSGVFQRSLDGFLSKPTQCVGGTQQRF